MTHTLYFDIPPILGADYALILVARSLGLPCLARFLMLVTQCVLET